VPEAANTSRRSGTAANAPRRELGAARRAPLADSPPDLLGELTRFGGSALGSCCSLAVAASELCGDRRVRVELTDGRAGRGTGAGAPPVGAIPGGDGGDAWLLVPTPGDDGREVVRVWVEAEDRHAPLPGPPELGALVRCARLVLERHRLEAEMLRAAHQAATARASLAHRLRGHLNSALLRTESLLRAGVTADGSGMEEDLRAIHDAVVAMADKIREVLEEPELEASIPAATRWDRRTLVRLQDLVGTTGDIPPVRADRARLETALRELLELARRVGGRPELQPDRAGVRVTFGLEAPSRCGDGAAADDGPSPEAPGAPHAGRGPPFGVHGPAPEPTPWLGELVAEIGGRLWIEAGGRGLVVVTLLVPAEGPGPRP